MERLIKIIDDIKDISIAIEDTEKLFLELKEQYIKVDAKRRDLYMERKKLVSELTDICSE